jgi:beta-ribofuranosylaminobenzene 5'-phosphate synthase
MTEVSITTGARLHFGPLSVTAPAGGRFGGVGVMITSPRTRITARPAATDSVRGDELTTTRVIEFLRRIRETVPGRTQVPCEISIEESIPSHWGRNWPLQ